MQENIVSSLPPDSTELPPNSTEFGFLRESFETPFLSQFSTYDGKKDMDYLLQRFPIVPNRFRGPMAILNFFDVRKSDW
jgi:hypothetical protein